MNEIIQKAKEVRQKQKEYFKTRSAMTLVESKNLERELDKMLLEHNPKQQVLRFKDWQTATGVFNALNDAGFNVFANFPTDNTGTVTINQD